MKNFKLVNNLNLFTLMLVGLSFTASTVYAASPCDLSTPRAAVFVKKIVSAGRSSHIDQNTDQVMALCADEIIQIANGDPVLTSQLHCGIPRDMHDGYQSVHVDVIQTIPLTVTAALKIKCEKIARCIVNSGDPSYILNELQPKAAKYGCE